MPRKEFSEYTIGFGRIREAGKRPYWVWKCGCNACRELPPPQGWHGPFKSKRAAERDCVQCLELFDCDHMGMA
jgi:hypothetical protein